MHKKWVPNTGVEMSIIEEEFKEESKEERIIEDESRVETNLEFQ